MLVLSRKVGEKIVIGNNITLVVNKVAGNRCSVGIDAPSHVRIVRGELADKSRAVVKEDEGPEAATAVNLPGFELPASPVADRTR
jgi:carbon storage regulator